MAAATKTLGEDSPGAASVTGLSQGSGEELQGATGNRQARKPGRSQEAAAMAGGWEGLMKMSGLWRG